jgi:hypothetical protein
MATALPVRGDFMSQFRSWLLAALALGLAAPASAQPRPAPKAAPKAAEPAPPPIFPCRTKDETCFLAVVIGQQVGLVYTNAPAAQNAEPKPVDVTGPDGSKIDLSKDDGRVVMLTGTWDAKAGITKAEVVETASPLASLAIKAQLGSGEDGPPASGKPAARRR